MSRIDKPTYVCDRCGVKFTATNETGTNVPNWHTLETRHFCSVGRDLPSKDLCEVCWVDFETFMGNYAVGPVHFSRESRSHDSARESTK